MERLNAKDVAVLAGGRLCAGPADLEVVGVSIDSRTAAPGDLFIPLQGARHDGHDFIGQARERGATGCLIREDWLRHASQEVVNWHPQSFFAVVVRDTTAAFHTLARAYRDRFRIPVVGVTGSNGKTTTKDLLYSILARRGPALRSEKNLNTEYGLPLTLLNMTRAHWAAVVEMGMRGAGQIAQLAHMASPRVGVITNVGPVHMELLGSLEAIAAAKAELIEALPQDGWAVLNADDAYLQRIKPRTKAQTMLFGFGAADVRAEQIRSLGAAGYVFELVYDGHATSVKLPLVGRHNIYNALAAAAAAFCLGLEPELVAAGLADPQLSGMRLELIRLTDLTVISDAFNASPASMRSALEVLAELSGQTGGRAVAVLGDMRELGPVSEQAHREIGTLVARLGIGLMVGVGQGGATIALAARDAGLPASQVMWFPDAQAAVAARQRWVQPGDVVLVKASRALQLEQIVQALVGDHGPGQNEPGGEIAR